MVNSNVKTNMMPAFLRLIRLPNLIMIVIIQYSIRWCLFYPILKARGFELQMSNFNFFLLVLSTVMIAAAGYIINDYFDVQIDRINKPDRLVIDIDFSRRYAMAAHLILNVLGLLIGVYLSGSIGLWKMSILFFITSGGLWYYSTLFKRKFLIGNFLIALFSAFVPLIVGLFEIPLLINKYRETLIALDTNFNDILAWILIYSLFAFLVSLAREIIKDIEDVEGDKEYGCTTLPIVAGIKTAKAVAVFIITIVISIIAYLQYLEQDKILFIYIFIALEIPLAFLIIRVIGAKEKKDFRIASRLVKIIMVAGICFLIVFCYLLLTGISNAPAAANV
jgi:4-hydroxybenzoate polyprenyltransferase